ncbi:putative cinnamyl alcohol dehydrogenase 8A [Triticum urartu]|uniref:cinnamyl-alcohol dehydrogenase n=1 Tax=Triticum urartu TaxID=4572 RepID=M8A7M7_TRIUA|nr:putative cinnamyl alcohol dehydrogenase 8A [Triticum urartu]
MAQESKPALGWAARDASGLLSPYSFSRRAQKEDDVTIKVLFCGICHTDLHVAKNEWGNAMYPVVPGHEIVGVVTGVGRGVWSFKAGDTDYVLRVPEGLPPAGAAPLLCAGVTVYSPMVQYGLNAPGMRLGVVGLGGLGHMAVKFGKAFGMTRLAGSGVGSVRDCQAMLDFAGEHGIAADVEVVKMEYVNTAMERLERNDVRYRFVIDVAGSIGCAAV